MQRKPFPIHIQSAPSQGLDARLSGIAATLHGLNESEARRRFGLDPNQRLLKTTISLCPKCLSHTSAAVFATDGKVLKATLCNQHGISVAILENDKNYYFLSTKDRWGRAYTSEHTDSLIPFEEKTCCGGATCEPTSRSSQHSEFTDQSRNKTCTVLIEITDACNLACRVCYADSKGDRLIPFDDFCDVITRLIALKSELDSVQITGGEASLHPDFWRMLKFLYEQPAVKKIYLPTNGIEFSKSGIAKRLSPFRDKVLVLLQFDGEHTSTNHALRDATPQTLRQRLLKTLQRYRIGTQLTMTLARNVSEREIAWVVQQGIAHRNVRLVALLPTFYSGRYQLAQDPISRLTLSDVIKGVALGLSACRTGDFKPIPCSHPNCGWAALFARRFGFFTNISRFINVEAVKPRIAYKTLLNKAEMQGIVGAKDSRLAVRWLATLGRRLIRPQDVFGIVVKPFMDLYTYDQDRISSCCHHTVDTAGNLMSFCEYNALKRNSDPWNRFPKLEGHKSPSSVTSAN